MIQQCLLLPILNQFGELQFLGPDFLKETLQGGVLEQAQTENNFILSKKYCFIICCRWFQLVPGCSLFQQLLEISSVQKDVLPSHKLPIWVVQCFLIKGRQPLTEKFLESFESSKFVSHRTKTSGEFDSTNYSHSV